MWKKNYKQTLLSCWSLQTIGYATLHKTWYSAGLITWYKRVEMHFCALCTDVERPHRRINARNNRWCMSLRFLFCTCTQNTHTSTREKLNKGAHFTFFLGGIAVEGVYLRCPTSWNYLAPGNETWRSASWDWLYGDRWLHLREIVPCNKSSGL